MDRSQSRITFFFDEALLRLYIISIFIYGNNLIYVSLADIISFGSLCIVVSLTVLKRVYYRRFSHPYKECFGYLSNRREILRLGFNLIDIT